MTAACPVFGFELDIRLHDTVGEAAADALWHAFLAEAVESRALDASGGRGRTWRITIRGEGGQATDADRVALSAWAAARDEIASCEVGPLMDLSGAA